MRAAIDTKVQDRVRPLSKVSQGLLKRHFTVHPTFVAFCSNLFLMRLICTTNIPPSTRLNRLLTHCGSNTVISVDINVVNSFHSPSPTRSPFAFQALTGWYLVRSTFNLVGEPGWPISNLEVRSVHTFHCGHCDFFQYNRLIRAT